jgi:hypothetical protein
VLGMLPDAEGVPNRLVIRRTRSIGRDLHLPSVESKTNHVVAG